MKTLTRALPVLAASGLCTATLLAAVDEHRAPTSASPDGVTVDGRRASGGVAGPLCGACEDANDDGTGENALSFGAGNTIVWANLFSTLSGNSTDICSIEVAWFAGTPTSSEGSIATVFIYSDPNNDQNPDDAVNEFVATVTTSDHATDTFSVYEVDPPVTVSGNYWVGAAFTADAGGGDFPARFDFSTEGGASYIAANPTVPTEPWGAGAVNPQPLANLASAFEDADWMVRGVGEGCVAGPHPPTNDLCANAHYIYTSTCADGTINLSGSRRFDTTDATTPDTAPGLSCGTEGAPGPDVWYRTVPGAGGQLTITVTPDGGGGTCNEDVDKDGDVDVDDLVDLILAWDPAGNCAPDCGNADVDGDSDVDVDDLVDLILAWDPQGINCDAGGGLEPIIEAFHETESGDCNAGELLGCIEGNQLVVDVTGPVKMRIAGANGTAGAGTIDISIATPPNPDIANDACGAANIQLVDGINPEGGGDYSNVGANTDGPCPHSGAAFDCDGPSVPGMSNDVWFDYSASCTGILTITTCPDLVGKVGSTFDTDIMVYTGGPCPFNDEDVLACNDDDPVNPCGGAAGGWKSTVFVPVAKGSEYVVRVGGTGPQDGAENEGTFQLSVTCSEAENDFCEFPTDMNVGDTSSDDTSTADGPAQGPLCGLQAQTQSGRWFRVAPHGDKGPKTLTAQADLTGIGGFHRCVVYCGDCNGLTCIADGSDSTPIPFCADPESEYLIVVYPESEVDVGTTFDLTVTTDDVACKDPFPCGPAPGDECATAISLDLVTGETTSDSRIPQLYTTNDGQDPEPGCQFDCGGGAACAKNGSWYYTLTLPADATSLTVSACDTPTQDTILTLYSGECGDVAELVCDDDFCTDPDFGASEIVAEGLTGGETYILFVELYSGGFDPGSPVTLNITPN